MSPRPAVQPSVLIVDDEARIRDLLVELLEDERHLLGPLRVAGAELLVLETKTCPKAITFGQQFSVCRPCPRRGFSGRRSPDLVHCRQRRRTDPWKLQPLGIGDTRHLADRGAAPVELHEDCGSRTQWEFLYRERVMRLHIAPAGSSMGEPR